MRILPQVSQPTLDSFRKDVYRPRLALLLLILLLGGKKPASSNWLSEINKVSASAIDDTTLEPLPSAASTSFLSLDRLRAPFISNTKQADQAKQGKSRKVKQTSSMGKGQKSKVDAAQSNSKSTDDLSTVSALRIPRLGLQLLLRGQALSAIVPLHILWIVRLAGMVVEDSIVKVSNCCIQLLQHHSNSHSFAAATLAANHHFTQHSVYQDCFTGHICSWQPISDVFFKSRHSHVDLVAWLVQS
jgi:hypothetical protein